MFSVWFCAGKGNPTSIPTVEILNLRRTTLMNEDRVIGNAKNVGGRVEEGLGRATGDVKSRSSVGSSYDGKIITGQFWTFTTIVSYRAVNWRRRHQPRRPPLAKIRQGSPAPSTGD